MGDLHAVPHGTSSEGSHHFTWTGSLSGYFLPKKTHSQIHCFQGTKQLFLQPLLFPLGIYSTTLYDPSGWNSIFSPCPTYQRQPLFVEWVSLRTPSCASSTPSHLGVVQEHQGTFPDPNAPSPDSFISIIPNAHVCNKSQLPRLAQ